MDSRTWVKRTTYLVFFLSVPTENIFFFNYFQEMKDKPDTRPPAISLRMCLHCNWRCACSTRRFSTPVKRGQRHWCRCRLTVHTSAVSSGSAQLVQPLSSQAGWLRTLISAYTWHASQKLQSCLGWVLNKCSLKAVSAEGLSFVTRNRRVLGS